MTPTELQKIRHDAERQYGGTLTVRLVDEYIALKAYVERLENRLQVREIEDSHGSFVG